MPITQNGGKCSKDCILVVILVWGFVVYGVYGVCEEFSIELGFEVSGYERKPSLVSQNGVFAFGFLHDYWKNDDGFVVGIWYDLGSKTANVPVWTAGSGGGVLVSENSTIRLSMDGSLALYDNLTGVIVWSSSTEGLGVQSASLLNNGNLVLTGSGGKVVWESFSSPTNVLLPDQTLSRSQSLIAPSKGSISYYRVVIRHSGEIALVWENNVTYWSSPLDSSSVVKEARFESDGVFGLVNDTGSMIWFKSSDDLLDSSVVLRHLRVDPDGNLRIYSWDNVLRLWKVGWQAVENQCKVFAACGLYGLCGYDSDGPACKCMFSDGLDWEESSSMTGDSGCKKMADLGNCKMGTSISTKKHTVLYALYPPHDDSLMLNQEACKENCSRDTSCIAATSMNDGSGLCTLKRTSFISGYQDPSSSAVSFMKACLVPQAVSTRVADPHGNVAPKSLPQIKNWKNFIVHVIVIVVVSACVFLGLEILVFLFIHRRRLTKAQSRIPYGKEAPKTSHNIVLMRLSFEEVKVLTANFKDQLSPTVFKGIFPNRTPVILKVLKSVELSERDFRMAVTTLGTIHHENLVQLRGFCFEPEHKILLYEYIPNGSLAKWLLDLKRDHSGVKWQQKLDISRGIAKALAYLHSESQQCIAHGNLKLENVLLDEKLTAKVANFGLQGLDKTESASSSESLHEKDIYMFGQILLQILVGQQDIAGFSPDSLIHDRKSMSSLEWEGIERACRIALWCTQDRPFLRPSMGEVVNVLEGNISVDRPPPSVAFKKENQLDCEETPEIHLVSEF